MKKKFLAVLLASAMVSSLAACGSSADNAAETPAATETPATTEAPAAETPAAEAPAEEEVKETVTFMVIDLNAGQSNVGDRAEEIITTIEDYCNVDLELDWVLNDSLEERGTLALASPKTMPMIMTWGGKISSTVVAAAQDGAFVDLTNYIYDAEKYPNLSQLDPDVAANLTIGGQLIGIPRLRELGRYGLSYRQDWADKLNITEPKTPDDVYDMMYAFTYDDPDGDGKDNTVGMEMCSYTGPFDIIQCWFGVGNGWIEKDGKLIPAHQQDEYKEALDYIKKIFDNGCMPANWAEIPTDTWSNGCKNGENGVYIDVMDSGRRIWDYFVNNEIKSVVDDTQYASMNLLGPINGKTPCLNVYNGYFTLSASTCDSESKIAAALRLLDRVNDNDMRLLTEYGIEGYNWERDAADSNIMVRLDQDGSDAQNAMVSNYKGLNQMLAYIPNYTPTPAAAITDRQQALNDCYEKRTRPVAVYNPALALLPGSATYADKGSTIDAYISEARSQYISGVIDWAGVEAAMDRWSAEGGDQVIEEINALYKG